MEQIIKIPAFILESFIHIWPYLLITIPIAVAIQLSGAAKFNNKILHKKPFLSIIIATAIGAISPFCSCGVIPVIASLLIGGIPLAPVMSFWIASPSMDPEIFFLSVAAIGWRLSMWRLTATFVISFSSGLAIHYAQKRGFIGTEVLREHPVLETGSIRKKITLTFTEIIQKIYSIMLPKQKASIQMVKVAQKPETSQLVTCCLSADIITKEMLTIPQKNNYRCEDGCGLPAESIVNTSSPISVNGCLCENSNNSVNQPFIIRFLVGSWKSFSMVTKFMTLAFFINALIEFYLPKNIVSTFIGGDGPFSVLVAALVGIPFYTSNITALPLVSGLLSLGMNQGAALAFLIAGPVTTIPAMMAVWGIVKPKVFLFYLFFSFFGALIFGYLYNFMY
jgi:hypothetical protein